MPSVSARQQRFMGADLARAEAGKKTRTGMSVEKLREWAKKGYAEGGEVRQSLREENQAIHDYTARAAHAETPEAKEVFLHNRNEEREHAAKLRGLLAMAHGGVVPPATPEHLRQGYQCLGRLQ